MLYILIGLIGTWVWIAYEAKCAPYSDEDIKTFHKKPKK